MLYSSEVATPKLPPPPRSAQQIGIAVLARGCDDLARGEHHLGRQQVVDRHPVLAHQPSDSPAERETRDPRTRDDTARRSEPEGGGTVELTDGHTRLGPSRGSNRIDVDALHQREVDHQPALGDRLAGDAVTAATNRDLDSFAPAEA